MLMERYDGNARQAYPSVWTEVLTTDVTRPTPLHTVYNTEIMDR